MRIRKKKMFAPLSFSQFYCIGGPCSGDECDQEAKELMQLFHSWDIRGLVMSGQILINFMEKKC